MAINSFRDYQEMMAKKNAEKKASGDNYQNSNSNSTSIQFFKLAAGETVLVRFNIDTMDSIPFASVHHAKFGKAFAGNKNRFAPVKCLQENCPFCVAAAKEGGHEVVDKKSFRIFVEMLVSRFDKSTNTWLEAVPMVWERTGSFGEALDVKINQLNGGKLSDNLCTITRTGSTKDDTTYSVDFALPQIYPDTLITKDFSAFDNLKIDKFSYYVKSADEMNAFLTTGSFPEVARAEVTPQPTHTVAPQPTVNSYAGYANPQYGQPMPNAQPATPTFGGTVTPASTVATEAPKKNVWNFN